MLRIRHSVDASFASALLSKLLSVFESLSAHRAVLLGGKGLGAMFKVNTGSKRMQTGNVACIGNWPKHGELLDRE